VCTRGGQPSARQPLVGASARTARSAPEPVSRRWTRAVHTGLAHPWAGAHCGWCGQAQPPGVTVLPLPLLHVCLPPFRRDRIQWPVWSTQLPSRAPSPAHPASSPSLLPLPDQQQHLHMHPHHPHLGTNRSTTENTTCSKQQQNTGQRKQNLITNYGRPWTRATATTTTTA